LPLPPLTSHSPSSSPARSVLPLLLPVRALPFPFSSHLPTTAPPPLAPPGPLRAICSGQRCHRRTETRDKLSDRCQALAATPHHSGAPPPRGRRGSSGPRSCRRILSRPTFATYPTWPNESLSKTAACSPSAHNAAHNAAHSMHRPPRPWVLLTLVLPPSACQSQVCSVPTPGRHYRHYSYLWFRRRSRPLSSDDPCATDLANSLASGRLAVQTASSS